MPSDKWTVDRVTKWYSSLPWLVGCNFIPSTAINQLEMWQAESFDPGTIDRELKWAEDLGFTAVRVYLHDLLWWQDAAGFKDRIHHYLDLAHLHAIKTIFVLFDDCWHDNPELGKQPEPEPGVHNSGWVKSPGTKLMNDSTAWARLEDYVTDIVSTFGSDDRVLVWDVYNEPGNNFLLSLKLPIISRYAAILSQLVRQFILPSKTEKLLRGVFAWARAAEPQQPLTSGLWYLRANLEARLNHVALDLSDVITFHSYFDLPSTSGIVDDLRTRERPVICTEYLARNTGSRFETHLPFFKKNGIGCFNWGLVSGKTQTMYSWEDYYPSGEEPPLWFHDILRPDGTPYLNQEVEFIRAILRFNDLDRSGNLLSNINAWQK